ncbi:MAG: thioredoxin family protein [Candidatus Sumerlaeia bacterium]
MEDLPQHIEEQMRNNLFFLLEQMAAQELLLLEASGKDAAESQTTDDPDTRINQHLESRFGAIEASDQEVTAFYEANKNMFGGASLDQIKDELQQYVSSQKQQEAVNEHLRTIGQRREIALSAEWVKRQADLARNNPVDKARASGRPSLVDFGSVGCGPCDMMAPILETLAAKYDGTMNVEFIPVNEHQILAARYGVQSIPVQILFDKKGKEVWRHTGYISQADLEAQIAELGLE